MEETYKNFVFGERFNESNSQSTAVIDHCLMSRERIVRCDYHYEYEVYQFRDDGSITLSSTDYPGRFVYVPEYFNYPDEVVRWKEDCDFRQGQYNEYYEQKQEIEAIKNCQKILSENVVKGIDLTSMEAQYNEFLRWLRQNRQIIDDL